MMDAIVFLGTAAMFDLFVGFLIWRDILAYGPDRTPLTDHLTSVALPLSFVAGVMGILQLSGVV